ncbi:MAG: aldo/keto reductase [Pseudomonadota bacterium]|nr:aldo/keto reductase [Pseudomonadota bacterium]
MERRRFGRTDLEVSRLAFGCGAVGGLMVKGAPADQDRAVAWARDNGINFFDTAASYGNGASETNLGRALAGNTDGIVVSSKVGIAANEMGDIGGAIARAIDASLSRLKLDHVDLFQLHNTLGRGDKVAPGRGIIDADIVLSEIVPVFEKLRDAGKTRHLGFTAKGDADDLHALVASGAFDSAQIFYNLLVPSAGEHIPDNYPCDDFRELLSAADRNGVGSIGVRVLAGGALSGREERHPLGSQNVAPIGSDTDYATDVQHALAFQPLVADGVAGTLPELAMRYAISHPTLSTVEIGIANLEQVQRAAEAVEKGPLPPEVLSRIRDIQSGFASAG